MDQGRPAPFLDHVDGTIPSKDRNGRGVPPSVATGNTHVEHPVIDKIHQTDRLAIFVDRLELPVHGIVTHQTRRAQVPVKARRRTDAPAPRDNGDGIGRQPAVITVRDAFQENEEFPRRSDTHTDRGIRNIRNLLPTVGFGLFGQKIVLQIIAKQTEGAVTLTPGREQDSPHHHGPDSPVINPGSHQNSFPVPGACPPEWHRREPYCH